MKGKITVRALCMLLALLCLNSCATFDNTSDPSPIVTPPTTTTVREQEEQGRVTTENKGTSEITLPPDDPEPPQPRIEATSYEELAALAEDSSLSGADTVYLTKEMEILSEVCFSRPVSLCIEAQITCSAPISFETFDEGTILVDLADGVSAEGLDLRFDAPCCDLVWQGEHPYGSDESAAVLINVKTFNGVDLRAEYGIGGEGRSEITSFSVTLDGGSHLEWSQNGNVLFLAISYLISDKELENATASVKTSDSQIISTVLDLSPGILHYTLTDSRGRERTYMILTERITYNLPVFYINIENGEEVTSREEYLRATVSVDCTSAQGDFPSLDECEMLIRGRGHYSWKFDKKSYKIRFESKRSLLGLEKSKNWTLLANYNDRSLIQNCIALEMGKVMDNICYHSTQYPVDLFVNGSYRGVYTFGEQLEAKPERIDLEESCLEPDTDYLLEVGGYDEGDIINRDYFHAGTLKYVSIKHPVSADLSQEQLDYLIGYVKDADKAVRTLDNYEDYIDVDSLIDWVIIHELTYNLDCCFRRSCYLIKEKGGKLKMGPIWDFDLAFGSFYRYEEGDWATIGESGGYVGVTWMNYLSEDEAFMQRFSKRWKEIKGPLLDVALEKTDTLSALTAPSAEMNFKVWDLLGKSLPSQPSSHKKYDTYEKMVLRLRSFIITRAEWLDSELERWQGSDDSKKTP